MKWDEEKFGLEYDLDIFNVVAVNDFNMGAMENKGLNVFNTAYVLAKPGADKKRNDKRLASFCVYMYVCPPQNQTLNTPLAYLVVLPVILLYVNATRK